MKCDGHYFIFPPGYEANPAKIKCEKCGMSLKDYIEKEMPAELEAWHKWEAKNEKNRVYDYRKIDY